MSVSLRIHPRRPARLFIREWREHFRLTQEQLGARMGPEGVSGVTVGRWEAWPADEGRAPDINVQAALAEAMGILPRDLFRHPDQPSADDLLRGQPADVVDTALRMLRALRRG